MPEPPKSASGEGSRGVFVDADAAVAEGWAIGSIPTGLFDAAALVESVAEIRAGAYGEQHSLLIAHRGVLIWDEHFDAYDQPEPDERRYNWRRRSAAGTKFHDVQSATKSILALLAGVALRDGHLGGLDDAIAPYLGGYEAQLESDARWQAVTVRHLLEMKAGFEWADEVHGMPALESGDWTAYVLERPFVADPGATFAYSSGASVLLGKVLTEAANRSLDEVAAETLFGPLGIAEWHWITEGDRPGGLVHGGGGLQLLPRDFAKFGVLVAQGGEWHGRRVVPGEYVQAAITDRVSDAGAGDRYGYCWWLYDLRDPDGAGTDVAVARGWGGQNVFVVPRLGLVVALTAGNYEAEDEQLDVFFKGIVPTLQPGGGG